ncbi:FecR family protein [Microbulbifer sp. 2304DJ12-6]|uniref:FecR family protein n=1 Tax=Microbulbifer sp. 2304DJ12-6 TaxID=3233340 RepID=UPI0039B06050
MSKEIPINPREEQAIFSWFLHGAKEKASPQKIKNFEVWLRESQARCKLAQRIERIWNHQNFEQALLQIEQVSHREQLTSRKTFMRPWYLAIAASLLLVMTATIMHNSNTQRTIKYIYQTEPKQVSRQKLTDGSILDLSATTKVAVSFNERKRRIRLFNGEAQFSVAKDPSRPFVVESRQASIRALGTIFNVDQRYGFTELTVLEGEVVVNPLEQTRKRYVVAAGEMLRITEHSIGAIKTFDLAHYKSWIDGYIQVKNQRLSDLLVEFNRFTDTPLTTKGHEIGSLLVSGSFDLKKIDTNIQILAKLHNLKIQHQGSHRVLESSEEQTP